MQNLQISLALVMVLMGVSLAQVPPGYVFDPDAYYDPEYLGFIDYPYPFGMDPLGGLGMRSVNVPSRSLRRPTSRTNRRTVSSTPFRSTGSVSRSSYAAIPYVRGHAPSSYSPYRSRFSKYYFHLRSEEHTKHQLSV